MRSIGTWFVAIATVALLVAPGVLVACGSGADSFAGTWVGPTLGPSPEPGTSRMQFVIKPANDGWWSITNVGSSTKAFYAAKIGD
jgi:hypothetical protein